MCLMEKQRFNWKGPRGCPHSDYPHNLNCDVFTTLYHINLMFILPRSEIYNELMKQLNKELCRATLNSSASELLQFFTPWQHHWCLHQPRTHLRTRQSRAYLPDRVTGLGH